MAGRTDTGGSSAYGSPGLGSGLRPRGERTRMQALTLFGYAFLSNVALAVLPHEPAVIWYGAQLGVWPTTLVATAGTVAAALVDHQVFVPLIRRLRDASAPSSLQHWFRRAPFAIV